MATSLYSHFLEQICSPLVLHETERFQELLSLVDGCVTKHHVHHYRGFAKNQWGMLEKEDPPRVKPLCNVYRVLLTGIHLMRTGKIECNLLTLNEEFQLPQISELVQRKTGGPEKAALDPAELTFHRGEFDRLLTCLDASARDTGLREKPTSADALDDLLLRLRLPNHES